MTPDRDNHSPKAQLEVMEVLPGPARRRLGYDLHLSPQGFRDGVIRDT